MQKGINMQDNSTPITDRGVFLVQRKWMDFDLFKKEIFTTREAWIYLLEEASYEEKTIVFDDLIIDVKRGQLVKSSRFLETPWGWKKDRIRRYLKKLETLGWISLNTKYPVKCDTHTVSKKLKYDNRPFLITIIKYNELQTFPKNGKSIENTSNQTANTTLKRQISYKTNEVYKPKELNNSGRSKDRHLYEIFPDVTDAMDFINYIPQSWKDYYLQSSNGNDEKLELDVNYFWSRYAGHDEIDRAKRSNLEKRTNWLSVWKKWCDKEFRNYYKK